MAECVEGLNTLIDYRYQQHFKAKTGMHGMGKNRAGGRGADAVLKVPAGTQIFEEDGETLIADLTEVGQRVVIAKGGNGGFGNAHFKTSTNRAPRRANPGQAGEETHDLAAPEADRRRRARRPAQRRQVDVSGDRHGRASRRSPIIRSRRCIPASASSTVDGREFVLADIPGLIEGAHEGHGLGDRFLGHVERCGALLHLVDATGEHAGRAYRTVRQELDAYGAGLAEKPEIVALSKIDAVDAETLKQQIERLRRAMRELRSRACGRREAGADPAPLRRDRRGREGGAARAARDRQSRAKSGGRGGGRRRPGDLEGAANRRMLARSRRFASMPRQLNIRSDEAYETAHRLADHLGETTTKVVEDALRAYGAGEAFRAGRSRRKRRRRFWLNWKPLIAAARPYRNPGPRPITPTCTTRIGLAEVIALDSFGADRRLFIEEPEADAICATIVAAHDCLDRRADGAGIADGRSRARSETPRTCRASHRISVAPNVEIVDFTSRHMPDGLQCVRALWTRVGIRRSLNFGDCMAYAVARLANAPLLYKGDDFSKTDIAAAVPQGPK